jgi:hypothetical protein
MVLRSEILRRRERLPLGDLFLGDADVVRFRAPLLAWRN